MMLVDIWLKETSQPIEREQVLSTYQKGDFYCVLFSDKNGMKWVEKFPVANIWKIKESYDL